MSTPNEALLLSDLETIVSAGIDAELTQEFGDFVRTSTDVQLFRINPIRYAKEKSRQEPDVIDLFLNATKAGVLQMEWNIVCNSCGNVYKSFRNLAKVDSHFHCNLCDMENESNLDDVIQVVFTVDPRVRDIVFHHPEELPLDQRLFDFHYSESARTQVDEQKTVDYLREFTVALEYVEPGEALTVDVDLEEGSLLVRDWTTSFSLFVAHEESAAKTFQLSIADKGLAHDGIPTSRVPIETPVGTLLLPAVHGTGPGPVRLVVTNDAYERRPIWVVRYPSFFVSQFLGGIEASGPLTAKRLLNTPTFQKLFRFETPGEGEGLTVTDLTYVFTDLKGSTAMYDEIGDATAYNLVRDHFGVIDAIVAGNHGVVVKTIGDAVMATFLSPTDAVTAALQMVTQVSDAGEHLELKVGVHRGYSIAVTLNQRLDYFGQNVNIAARTQQLAGGSEVLLTQDVMEADGVSELLSDLQVAEVSTEMKGVAEEIAVFRVTDFQNQLVPTPTEDRQS